MKRLIPYLILALSSALTVPAAQAGKLYKWVDENGQIRYGDRIPPQYARKSNETLNQQGITVNRQAAAKTPEQIAEEQRLEEARIAAEKLQQEQDRSDQILLDTFTNEDEMVLTRDGKIEAIEAIIRVTNGRTEKLKLRLSQLKSRAANIERSGKPVSEKLNAEIRETRQQIAHNFTYVKSRNADKKLIREQFEKDIARFRELQAEKYKLEQAAAN
jgi:Domain of unknown function (DUF4124)